MTIQEQILSVGREKKVFKASDVARRVPKFSRQYISAAIGQMVKAQLLIREGSGRWSTYALPEFRGYLGHKLRRRLKRLGLKEHEVLNDVMSVSTVLSRIPESVRSIFNYAFSEMLNNAIDHSRSVDIVVEVNEENEKLRFVIDDYGVGVFRNVMNERRLKNELEAIQDLLKGKTTTAPQAHSGEGIFFTSKIADIFILESYGLRLRIDNQLEDIFVEELAIDKKGTKVIFEISTKSKKHLAELFTKFQAKPGEPAFDKTEIKIKLYTMGTVYVSRSQARRVLVGLEKFRSVVLDFENVPTIGQAFADEIFRVFQTAHPSIEIHSINTNEAVQFMITRSQATS